MKIPIILITYGFSNKLCTYEKDDMHILPLFNEPAIASLFLDSFRTTVREMLGERELPQLQICHKAQYMIDVLTIVGITDPTIQILYNAAPISDDPEAAIATVMQEFTSTVTSVNKSYTLEEAIEVFQEASEPADFDDSAS
jgi:hypothetical protein